MSANDRDVFLADCNPNKGSTMNIQLVKVKDTKMENTENNPSLPIKYIYDIYRFIDTHECMPHKYACPFWPLETEFS